MYLTFKTRTPVHSLYVYMYMCGGGFGTLYIRWMRMRSGPHSDPEPRHDCTTGYLRGSHAQASRIFEAHLAPDAHARSLSYNVFVFARTSRPGTNNNTTVSVVVVFVQLCAGHRVVSNSISSIIVRQTTKWLRKTTGTTFPTATGSIV